MVKHVPLNERTGRTGRRRNPARPRATTVPTKKLTKAVMREFSPYEFAAELALQRPTTRGECGTARPCPWVSCRHNLYLEITDIGSLKFTRPDLKPWEMPESCALDVADRGGLTLEETGDILNITRERCRQLEVSGLITLRRKAAAADLNPNPATRGRRAA